MLLPFGTSPHLTKELTPLPCPLAGGEGVCCPHPKTIHPDLSHSDFKLRLFGPHNQGPLTVEPGPSVPCWAIVFLSAVSILIPRSRLRRYGSRSFAVCGPTAWNSLPAAVCDFSSSSSSSCFCGHLKKLNFFAEHMALTHRSTFVIVFYKNGRT